MVYAEQSGRLEASETFSRWYEEIEPRLRIALTAAFGVERGLDATAEAMAWAWEHQDRLACLTSPVGFLFRVGQSRTRFRRQRVLYWRAEWSEPWFEPALGRSLRSLSERQRVAVVLIHAYGWSFAEVADLLGIKVTTVQNHLDRGLAGLRSALEVDASE